jgi:general secretion pathway protein J
LRKLEPAYPYFRQSAIPSGFTLLELMISLTIMGLVLVLVFGSLRIGARAWEKGEREAETHQRQRVVLDNIRRQIASLCLHEIREDEKEGPANKEAFFRGDREGMEFISRVPMSPMTRTGMVYVKYVVREDEDKDTWRLLLYEKDVVFFNKKEDLGDLEEAEFFELIPGAANIEFSYLKGPGDTDAAPEWQDEWDPDSDKGIPMAVRIALQEKVGSAPIYVIARLQVEADQQPFEKHNKK